MCWFHIFALLCGVVSLLMLAMHGGTYLQMRTAGPVHERARRISVLLAVVVAVAFAIGGFWVSQLDGYVIKAASNLGGVTTPLQKSVELQAAGWLDNYGRYPWMLVAPVVAFIGLALTALLSMVNRGALAFISSSFAVTGIICTAGFSLFPFLMPSSTDPSHSLTMWDVTSSQLTLHIMFWVAMIFVPIILSYTAWGYYKMWGRLTTDFIEDNQYSTY